MIKCLIFLLIPFPILALIITEVQIHGDLADNDYIKIYNSQEIEIDASSFRLRKKTATGTESSIRVFPKETIIPANEYFLWANSKNNFHLDIKADVWSKAYLAKNNSIALLDNKNNILDSLSWGQIEAKFKEEDNSYPNPKPNQRLVRKKINSIYQNNFYLTPEEIKKIENIPIIKTDSFDDKINYQIFIRAFLISFFSALIILFLKKYLDFY